MSQSRNSGFTLIEMLAVMAMMSIVSGALILNFRTSSTSGSARIQTTSVIVSDIRRTQSMAISGTKYQDGLVCGFGLHYVSASNYIIYTRLVDSGYTCLLDPRSRNYIAGSDPIVENKVFQNSNMQFRGSFADIFFQIPDPLTFIDNNSSPMTLPVRIDVTAKINLTPVTQIVVYPSGKIDIIDELL